MRKVFFYVSRLAILAVACVFAGDWLNRGVADTGPWVICKDCKAKLADIGFTEWHGGCNSTQHAAGQLIAQPLDKMNREEIRAWYARFGTIKP